MVHIQPTLEAIRAARHLLLPGNTLSVEDIFNPYRQVSSPAEWEATEVMGGPSDISDVAKRFIKDVEAKDNPGTLLNSPLELCVAREIFAFSLTPFMEQHKEV